jgi:uncharacterized oxidoreductase
MKTSENTVLIIGGSAGIGLEIAKLAIKKGNKVIITGRDKKRLDSALSQLQNGIGIVSDVSKKEDLENLASQIKNEYPEVNIVINNAGRALVYDILTQEDVYDIAEDEIRTNYLSIIRANERLLPLLSTHKEAAIVNVSSVVAFVPGSLITYSASKAALHSYTQSLRIALERAGSSVKVFELMPPLVNTELSAPIGGENGIPPSQVADEFFAALETNDYEIRVGNTQYIYDLYLQSPAEALKVMNQGRE